MGRNAGAVRRRMKTVQLRCVAALPYAFGTSGLALGAGGVATGRPLAGLCGAVAGVTAGVLERHRSRDFARRGEALRERLRRQRTDSDTTVSALRREVRELRVEVWEWRSRHMLLHPAVDVAMPVTAAVDPGAIAAGPSPAHTGSTPVEAIARAAMAVEDAAARISAEAGTAPDGSADATTTGATTDAQAGARAGALQPSSAP